MKLRRFKRGDRVKVRSDLNSDTNYYYNERNALTYNSQHVKLLRGQSGTIMHEYSDLCYAYIISFDSPALVELSNQWFASEALKPLYQFNSLLEKYKKEEERQYKIE